VHTVFFDGVNDLPVLMVCAGTATAAADEDGKGFLGGGLGMFVF
jgi:hypothetical protein